MFPKNSNFPILSPRTGSEKQTRRLMQLTFGNTLERAEKLLNNDQTGHAREILQVITRWKLLSIFRMVCITTYLFSSRIKAHARSSSLAMRFLSASSPRCRLRLAICCCTRRLLSSVSRIHCNRSSSSWRRLSSSSLWRVEGSKNSRTLRTFTL